METRPAVLCARPSAWLPQWPVRVFTEGRQQLFLGRPLICHFLLFTISVLAVVNHETSGGGAAGMELAC